MESQHGTREEHLDTLNEMTLGWWHLGKDALSEAASKAVTELENGADSVRVGHTTYVVS
ncbi:hypothetical protein [Streptomyces sp. NBC_01180]|uniref:hypothetical protein n=1 Tax=Streptomyces sp. NBC_01180 TaxID=2903763 RepID=UPI0038657765|nr:hypothetical protein OG708_08915 [Streptomyces sp. NBC_01180]